MSQPAGRLGDLSLAPLDSHGCPTCPHPSLGPFVTGSTNVRINGRPAARVGDLGLHAACCGTNLFNAAMGSGTVFINGKKAHRMGDVAKHCGGMGVTISGSSDVHVGGGWLSAFAQFALGEVIGAATGAVASKLTGPLTSKLSGLLSGATSRTSAVVRGAVGGALCGVMNGAVGGALSGAVFAILGGGGVLQSMRAGALDGLKGGAKDGALNGAIAGLRDPLELGAGKPEDAAGPASEEKPQDPGAAQGGDTAAPATDFNSARAIALAATDDAGDGHCARGVANILSDQAYPVTRGNATDWADSLPRNGWVRLENVTPQTAPPGAVVVYKSDIALGKEPRNNGGGRFGHVEIIAINSAGQRVYVADQVYVRPGGSVPDNLVGIFVYRPPGH